MDGISGKMVNELARRGKEFADSAKELNKQTRFVNEIFARELTAQLTEKFIDYVEHYSNATFATRWYWKRKIIRMTDYTLPYLFHFVNDIKEYGEK